LTGKRFCKRLRQREKKIGERPRNGCPELSQPTIAAMPTKSTFRRRRTHLPGIVLTEEKLRELQESRREALESLDIPGDPNATSRS
jgi:hypothetical protein